LNRVSISTIEIDSPRLLNRVNSNRQDLGRLIDLNSINRLDAISLATFFLEKSTLFLYNISLVSYLLIIAYIKLTNNYVEIYNKIFLMFDKYYKQIVEYALIRKFT